jgi:hypothetical protein
MESEKGTGTSRCCTDGGGIRVQAPLESRLESVQSHTRLAQMRVVWSTYRTRTCMPYCTSTPCGACSSWDYANREGRREEAVTSADVGTTRYRRSWVHRRPAVIFLQHLEHGSSQSARAQRFRAAAWQVGSLGMCAINPCPMMR